MKISKTEGLAVLEGLLKISTPKSRWLGRPLKDSPIHLRNSQKEANLRAFVAKHQTRDRVFFNWKPRFRQNESDTCV